MAVVLQCFARACVEIVDGKKRSRARVAGATRVGRSRSHTQTLRVGCLRACEPTTIFARPRKLSAQNSGLLKLGSGNLRGNAIVVPPEFLWC